MKLFGGRRERSPLRIYCDIVYSLDLDAQTRGKCLWVVLLPTVLLRGDQTLQTRMEDHAPFFFF